MGLLANNPQMMQQTANVQQPQTQAAQPNMQQQLAAEEQAMRQQAAQQQAQMPQQLNTAQLAEVCQRLGGYGCGFPALGGNAASAYAVLGGQQVAPGFVYPGIPAPPGARRSLHQVQLNEVAHIFMLESELAAERAAQTPVQQAAQQIVQQTAPMQQYAPVQMPTNTPPVTQAIANVYNQTIANPSLPPQQMQQQPVSFLPPGAPESMPQLAGMPPKDITTTPAMNPAGITQVMQYGGQVPQPAPEPEKKVSRGRPKKSQDAAPEGAAAAPATTSPHAGTTAMSAPPGAVSAMGGVSACHTVPPTEAVCSGNGMICVNGRVEGRNTKSLAGYVDYINDKLARMYNTTKDGKPGPLDCRTAVEGSILGYGGWKGAVRTVVQADPPPDGDYHFDTFMNELNEIVADSLRVVAEQKGWLYFRGVR